MSLKQNRSTSDTSSLIENRSKDFDLEEVIEEVKNKETQRKLDYDTVGEIKWINRETVKSAFDISNDYNIGVGRVKKIINEESYAHVDPKVPDWPIPSHKFKGYGDA